MTAPQFLLSFIIIAFLVIAGLSTLAASLPLDGEGP